MMKYSNILIFVSLCTFAIAKPDKGKSFTMEGTYVFTVQGEDNRINVCAGNGEGEYYATLSFFSVLLGQPYLHTYLLLFTFSQGRLDFFQSFVNEDEQLHRLW